MNHAQLTDRQGPNTGAQYLLWYDKSKRALHARIAPAVARYRERFGLSPNVCYVHPSEIADTGLISGLLVKTGMLVHLHYLWIGHEEIV